MTLNVDEIHDFKKPEVLDEILRDMESCEFLLNYFYKPEVAHAVYVKSYNLNELRYQAS